MSECTVEILLGKCPLEARGRFTSIIFTEAFLPQLHDICRKADSKSFRAILSRCIIYFGFFKLTRFKIYRRLLELDDKVIYRVIKSN